MRRKRRARCHHVIALLCHLLLCRRTSLPSKDRCQCPTHSANGIEVAYRFYENATILTLRAVALFQERHFSWVSGFFDVIYRLYVTFSLLARDAIHRVPFSVYYLFFARSTMHVGIFLVAHILPFL
jgi:hypothetical protein